MFLFILRGGFVSGASDPKLGGRQKAPHIDTQTEIGVGLGARANDLFTRASLHRELDWHYSRAGREDYSSRLADLRCSKSTRASIRYQIRPEHVTE